MTFLPSLKGHHKQEITGRNIPYLHSELEFIKDPPSCGTSIYPLNHPVRLALLLGHFTDKELEALKKLKEHPQGTQLARAGAQEELEVGVSDADLGVLTHHRSTSLKPCATT